MPSGKRIAAGYSQVKKAGGRNRRTTDDLRLAAGTGEKIAGALAEPKVAAGAEPQEPMTAIDIDADKIVAGTIQ